MKKLNEASSFRPFHSNLTLTHSDLTNIHAHIQIASPFPTISIRALLMGPNEWPFSLFNGRTLKLWLFISLLLWQLQNSKPQREGTVCLRRHSSFSFCPGIHDNLHKLHTLFLFLYHRAGVMPSAIYWFNNEWSWKSGVGCWWQWEGMLCKKEYLPFPAANFQTMLICQRDDFGKHLSFCWHISGSLSLARFLQYSFCLTVFLHLEDRRGR